MEDKEIIIHTEIGDIIIDISDVETYPSIQIQFEDEKVVQVDLDLEEKQLQASLWKQGASNIMFDHTVFHNAHTINGKIINLSYDNEIEDIFNSFTVKRARELAKTHHADQLDLAGKPYMEHIDTVALIVAHRTKNPFIVTAALLHDIIEDTDITAQELLDLGYPLSIVEAIQQLSRPIDQDYDEYIESIKSPIARYIKMADLVHNIDIDRLGEEYSPSSGDHARIAKYRKALVTLSNDKYELKRIYDIYDTIK